MRRKSKQGVFGEPGGHGMSPRCERSLITNARYLPYNYHVIMVTEMAWLLLLLFKYIIRTTCSQLLATVRWQF